MGCTATGDLDVTDVNVDSDGQMTVQVCATGDMGYSEGGNGSTRFEIAAGVSDFDLLEAVDSFESFETMG